MIQRGPKDPAGVKSREVDAMPFQENVPNMENQVEETMEHDMETRIKWQRECIGFRF